MGETHDFVKPLEDWQDIGVDDRRGPFAGFVINVPNRPLFDNRRKQASRHEDDENCDREEGGDGQGQKAKHPLADQQHAGNWLAQS